MSSEQFESTKGIEFGREAADSPATVQLLISDTGNRSVIQDMLDDHFDVETSETIRDADLYLIEDQLFAEYHEALRERVERAHPVFCPVVLIRRETTELTHPTRDAEIHEGPLLIDEVVDAPVDRSLLLRRLHSVLIRRRQSQELSNHVSTLETREQELRRFERGVESTGNGIVMTNRLGEIDYVNPAFEDMTGYAEAEVIGETPRVLQPAGAADVFTEDFWRTMIDRGDWAGDVVLEHRDETRSVVDTSVTGIHAADGDVEGFVVVMADVTQRIQQQEEIQRREEELERLRQILTRYLRHNLRNDLNVALGYGELLASDETLSDTQRQQAEKIVETAEGLIEKSDTARTYSTLLQQDTEHSPHNISKITYESTQKLRGQYPEVEFEIDVPETCDIRARTGIRDAIEELIENAAEHADDVTPHVHIQLQNSNGARLVIEDNGSGISDLELEALEKGEETPLSHSQGIGLWLSKWLIESIDGRLSFEQLDSGTRVIVDFPPPQRIGSGELDIPTLKEREQRLQTVLDRMTDAIVEVNASWEIAFMDPRAEEILDVSAEEIQGEEFWDVFSDLEGTQLEAVLREVMETRSSEHVEAYYGGIDDWVSVYIYPEFDGGLSFYVRETTERHRHDQELQRARSRMELALGVTDSTVWEWDVGTDSVTTHPEVHTVFGVEITTGDEYLAAVHPDDRERVQDALETALETETPYRAEYRVEREDEIRWIEDYGEPRRDEEDGSIRLIGVARDFTERKEREREYHRVLELLDHTEQIADVGGWEINPETQDVFWSDHLFEMLGWEDDEEPPLEEALDVYVETDRPRVENAVEEALAAGEPFDVEVRFQRQDGEMRWFRILGEPTLDGDEVLTLRGVVQDITEHKHLEQELRGEQQFVQSIFDALPDPLYAFDKEGYPIRWNERLEEVTGYTRDEIEGMHVTEFVPEDETDTITTSFQQILDAEKLVTVEAAFRTKGGERIPYEFTGGPLKDHSGNLQGATGIGRAIQARKEHEQALRHQNERLEEFAGIVSHDLRNPLNVAVGRLELAQDECDSEHLDQIDTALDRMERIIEDGLWLAREGREIDSTELVEIQKAVESAWNLVADSADRAELRFATETSRLPPIRANYDQLCQLLENLLRNAVEHGGDDVTVTVGALDGGFYLEDDGPGIPEESRDEVAEPGYSTSEDGIGFGLSIVKQVAQAHGWDVRVTDGSEGGARFEITGVEISAE